MEKSVMRKRTCLFFAIAILLGIGVPLSVKAQVSLPYSENFDGYTYNADMISNSSYQGCWENPRNYPNHTLPTGWDFPQMSLINNTNMTTTANMHPQFWMKNCDPHSLPHCFVFKAISSRPNAVAALPATSVPASRIHIEFWYRNETSGSSYTMEVGVITNANDSSTFRRLYTCPQTTTWTLISVDLYDYLGGTDYAAGTYRVALRYKNASGLGYRCAIDDLTLDDVDCFPPSQLTASEITSTSARLTWRDPHLAGRNYAISNGVYHLGNTTDTFFVATGLTPNTQYTLTVTDLCGKSANVTFTTPCEAYPIPYSENMDSYSTDISANTTRPGAYPNHTMPACWTFTGLNTSPTLSSLADYTFSTGTDATKWKTLTAYTDITRTGDDVASTATVPIGFAFPFGTSSYTEFSINSNGLLRLGPTITGTANRTTPLNSSNASVNNPNIIGFGCDGYVVSGTHHVYKQTFGDTLTVVEFCQGSYNSTTRNQQYRWQIHMYRTGLVEIVYSPSAPGQNPNTTFQIGLCLNNTDGWVVNSSHAATHFTNGSTTNWASGSWPNTNRYYSWQPPANYPLAFLTTYNAHLDNSLILINGSASDVSYSVLPQLTGANIDNMQLDFWYRQSTMSSMVGELTVGTMVDPNDGATFAPLYAVPRQTDWTHRIDNLGDYSPSVSARYIAFRYSGGLNGAEWTLIDSVQVRLACIPTSRDTSAVACDSYAWRGNTYLRPTPTPTFTIPHGNSTGCDSVIRLNLVLNYDTLPYYEDFERYTAEGTLISTNTAAPLLYPLHTMPPCWRILNLSFTKYTYPLAFITSHAAYQDAGSTKCLVMKSALSSSKLYYVMPSATTGVRSNLLKLAFKYKMNNLNAGTLNFGVMTNPANASTYVNLKTLDKVTSWTSISDTIGNYTSTIIDAGLDETPVYIAFRYDGQSSSYITFLDDIVISALPCENPTNLEVASLGATSATLRWNDNNGGIIVHYLWLNGVRVATIPAGTSTYTVTGLTPGTTYAAEITSPCSTTPATTSFTTPCSGALPYVEAFDSYTTGTGTTYTPPTGYPNTAMPECWLVPHKSTSTSTFPQAFITTHDPLRVVNKGFCIKTNPATKPGHAIINIDFGVDPLTLMLTYHAYVNGYCHTDVGFVTDPYDTNTFVPLITMAANHAMAGEDTLKLADYASFVPANTTVYFAFRAHNDVAGTGDNPWGYLGLDSVKIRQFICLPSDYTMEVNSCCSYTWIDGNTYNASTNTPVHVISNHCGGDSTVYLHLTVNNPVHTATSATECETYTWTSGDGNTYTASGDYTYSHTDANGCTQVDTLHLTINNPVHTATTATECETYTWTSGDGNTYTASGNYLYVHTDANSCTQVDTLHLTINNPVHVATTATECETYTWITGDGATYTATGTSTYIHTDANGCTQVDTLHLTINNPVHTATTATECETYTWTSGNGNTYTTSGNYTYSHTDANSCTQVDTLHLTINNPVHTATTATECETYTWASGDGNTYTASGNYLYAHTDANSCTQVDTLHLTINNPVHVATTATECETYTWTAGDGNTYTASGNYTYSHTDANNCTQVDTLHLTINNPVHVATTATECETYTWTTGDGNTYTTSGTRTYSHTDANSCTQVDTLHLTINNPVHTATTATECETYTWTSGDGNTYTVSGNYLYSHTDANSCTQVDTLHLTINNPAHASASAVVCETYTWSTGNGNTYTISGDYTHSHTDANGCTQVDTLHLTINNPAHIATIAAACETYTWTAGDGATYTASGNYTYIHTDANGCTQVDTLHLTISNIINTTTIQAACGSFTWTAGDGNTYTTSGTRTYSHTDAHNCTQVDTLHLTINNPVHMPYTQVACEAYTWSTGDGNTYTTSGNYTYSHPDANNCTQVDTLHLTINNPVHVASTDVACETYTWTTGDGATYTASGDYTYSHTDANGCTQVDTLHLTINNPVHVATTVTECETYTWTTGDGNTYTTSGTRTYSHTDANNCTQVDTLHLTINNPVHVPYTQVACETYTWTTGDGNTYTASGNYTYSHTDANSCTQVDTLHLTINNPVHTATTAAACETYTWTTGDGATYTASGDYTYSHTDANNCTQVDTLHLTINNPAHVATTAAACETYTWATGNGNTYTVSGNYTYTHTDANGCSQVDTLHLTISDIINTTTTQVACETFTWTAGDGNTYTTSGTHTYSHTDANNCTQVDTLHLTINNPVHTATPAAACNTYTWTTGDGNTYTTSGNYTYSHSDANNCTQVDTLHLTINNSTTADTVATACDNFAWHGITYSSTPTTPPTHTYASQAGCDSVVTLHLTINRSTTADSLATACDHFTWHGITYTSTPVTPPTFVIPNAAGCDSTITLLLTVSSSTAEDTTVVACESFTWHNTTYTSTPLVAPTHNYTNAAGCNRTVTLRLTINHNTTFDTTATACDRFTWHGTIFTNTPSSAPTYTLRNAARCDSVITLHLTINRSTTSDTTAVACDQFTWYGTPYTYSTTPSRTITNAVGCDSTVTLHLIIRRSNTSDTTAVACDHFTWHNATYNSSVTTQRVFQNRWNCDSTVTLHLTINRSTAGIDPQTACDNYTWRDGQTYTTPTTSPTVTLTNAVGCDSVLTLHLTLKQSTTATDPHTACDSYTWIDGQSYTQSNSTSTHTLTNAVGCDSVVTLNLTILNSSMGDTNATACDRFSWYGTDFTSSATPQHMTLNTVGCDSTITLHLTINHSATSTTPITACNNFQWHNRNYITSGTYQFDTLTTKGCDSTAFLNLTINHSNTGDTNASVCDRFSWYGQIFSTSSTASHTLTNAAGCDSVVTLHLTVRYSSTGSEVVTAIDSLIWHGTEYRISGTYHFDTLNAVGCDSTATLRLTINHLYHRVTLTADPSMGIVYPDRTSIVQHGKSFRAVATSLRGYRFIGWYDGSTPVSRDNPYAFNVVEDVMLTARFVPIDYLPDSLVVFFSVTDPALGTTTPAPGRYIYYYGDNIVASATVANGCFLDHWQVNGPSSDQSSTSFRLTVDSSLLGSILDVKAMIYADNNAMFYIDATPFNSAMGEVIGAGQYAAGSTVTLIAVPYRGYKFTGWSNGSMDELLVFTATDDVKLVAYFASDGSLSIGDLADDDFKVYAANGYIYVIGAEGKQITAYDVNGRCIERLKGTTYITRFKAHASGVYLVRVGSSPAKRVVVIR